MGGGDWDQTSSNGPAAYTIIFFLALFAVLIVCALVIVVIVAYTVIYPTAAAFQSTTVAPDDATTTAAAPVQMTTTPPSTPPMFFQPWGRIQVDGNGNWFVLTGDRTYQANPIIQPQSPLVNNRYNSTSSKRRRKVVNYPVKQERTLRSRL